ncbi:hypothetical protein Taro_045829 [Colocasia esculenta]|uniref:Uncharacterized protein n=1 Tax=Colocasia esculenta TaxID=4460 RepID=A0A843WXI5_COLES|nr:hypothetical protein [Colocasia esculenta]
MLLSGPGRNRDDRRVLNQNATIASIAFRMRQIDTSRPQLRDTGEGCYTNNLAGRRWPCISTVTPSRTFIEHVLSMELSQNIYFEVDFLAEKLQAFRRFVPIVPLLCREDLVEGSLCTPGFLLTPLVGHETDQVYVESQEVAVDSYCPPRTNSWGLNTACRQAKVGCRQVEAICQQLLVELLYLGSGSMIPVDRWVLSVDSCGLNFQK